VNVWISECVEPTHYFLHSEPTHYLLHSEPIHYFLHTEPIHYFLHFGPSYCPSSLVTALQA
jgi:hypothetical protein